jgi:hypothetical protein
MVVVEKGEGKVWGDFCSVHAIYIRSERLNLSRSIAPFGDLSMAGLIHGQNSSSFSAPHASTARQIYVNDQPWLHRAARCF